MINHLPVNQLHILNQINTNKIFDNNPTIKINRLSNCLYAPTNNLTKTIRINHLSIKAFNKSYNKSFISYNHFKGFKRDFNYKLYKSIELVRFWLVDVLKGFKIGINKIVRLKIYKYSLIKTILLISTNKIILKIILISNFGWRDIKVELYLTNLLKIANSSRFWGIFEPHFRMGNFAKDSALHGDLGRFSISFQVEVFELKDLIQNFLRNVLIVFLFIRIQILKFAKFYEVFFQKMSHILYKGGTKMNYDFKQYTLPKYSKDNYLAYWLKLLKKLDCRLGYIANDNVGYNPMSITDMADYLGISTLTCKRFIKESVELGIITKQLEKVVSQKRNVFRINPKYTLGILG